MFKPDQDGLVTLLTSFDISPLEKNTQLLVGKLKPVVIKRSSKNDREYQVLLGLVDFYIKTGRPVGSHTLKEAGFDKLSSATIRNYFAHLEEQGYLSQQHSSGGRIPTHSAYRVYAQEHHEATKVAPGHHEILEGIRQLETREIAAYMQKQAETLSSITGLAVFLSAPRFDNDYIIGLKLVPIDHNRCVCIVITDFGVVQTEVLNIDVKLTALAAKRIEAYFHWRLTGNSKPENFEEEEELLGKRIYNEIMVRYIVNYSNFIETELYRTGFSKLLSYPEFQDTAALANSLALFENLQAMRLLVKECCKINQLKTWIGDDLSTYSSTTPDCTVIAVPYQINQNVVGAIGLLGPTRVPYQELFGILRAFAASINDALTKNLYKFKITFRQPHLGNTLIGKEDFQPRLLEIIRPEKQSTTSQV